MVSIKSFTRSKGTAMSFAKIGDFIDGTVFDAALVDDIHNPGKEVLQLKITVAAVAIEGDPVVNPDGSDLIMDVWARGAGMQDALGEAVGKAGCDSIDAGARLRIEYVGEKVLPRTGRTMKLYAAIYEPPKPIGNAFLGDTEAPF